MKSNKNHRYLKGIEVHNAFLAPDTLSNMIEKGDIRAQLDKIEDTSLMAFKNQYQSFFKMTESDRKFRNHDQMEKLFVEWKQSVLNFLGYASFKEEIITIDRVEKRYTKALVSRNEYKEKLHSVLVFDLIAPNMPANFFDPVDLDLSFVEGKEQKPLSHKRSICEQIEKSLLASESAEAIVCMPHAVYYLRSDSAVAGQCLEIKWQEMIGSDNNQAICFAKYLCGADFFKYTTDDLEDNKKEDIELQALNESDADEDTEDGEGEGEDSSTGSGGISSRTTASAHLFKEDLEQMRQITERIHKQVVLALEILVNERLHNDKDLKSKALKATNNEALTQELFKDGLFIMYRILFMLYAEAKEFLNVENKYYASFYSVEHLVDWSQQYLSRRQKGEVIGETFYVWQSLKSMFYLLRRGVTLPGEEMVSPFNGQLFAQDRSPSFDKGPDLRDESMARIIQVLAKMNDEENSPRLHFGNLGVEQLGAVYEAMLSLKPVIVREKSLWVPGGKGGVGLVTERMANELSMERFDTVDKGSKKARQSKSREAAELDLFIDPKRPGYHPEIGTFIVAPFGGDQKQTASFYTPPKLASFLVKRTLGPLVKDKNPSEILDLKILEPVMGCGGFVIASVRFLAEALFKAEKKIASDNKKDKVVRIDDRLEQKSKHQNSNKDREYRELQNCKRRVIEKCIFGVDLNPLAIELARTTLYLEALVKGDPLPFLHHRLKSGNAFVGADFRNQSQRTLRKAKSGEEDKYLFPELFYVPVDDVVTEKSILNIAKEICKKNWNVDAFKKAQSERFSKIKAERKKMDPTAYAAWANAKQKQVEQYKQQCAEALRNFETDQIQSDKVNQLDQMHQDYQKHIPALDPVLIEIEGIKVDADLEKKRKKALQRELGELGYQRYVIQQKAYHRLKALGDLSTALWYWPLENSSEYPSYQEFQLLVDWLLDEKNMQAKKSSTVLPKNLSKILKIALKTSRKLKAFHWDLEFAQVFSPSSMQNESKESCAFSAMVSNPPWKALAIKEKDVIPQIDPQYLGVAKKKKTEYKKQLYKFDSEIPMKWFEEAYRVKCIARQWKEGQVGPIPISGQSDLATLITLKSERWLKENGRSGLLVSRTAVFTNKASKNLRERFFKEWGLQESISFINKMGLFPIDDRFEFVMLVGVHQKESKHSATPKFVSGIIDANILENVERLLDFQETKLNELSIPEEPSVDGIYRFNLDLKLIESFFDPENLSIPPLTHPKQIEIAKWIFSANGNGTVLLKNVINTESQIRKGLDATYTPKKGLSIFAEDMKPEHLPNWEKIHKGEIPRFVPLVSGENFVNLDPFRGNPKKEITPKQYLDRTKESGVTDEDLKSFKIMWRRISSPTNRRSLIVGTYMLSLWTQDNCFVITTRKTRWDIAAILSSTVMDFLVKLKSGMMRGKSEIENLPIALHSSDYIVQASKLAEDLSTKVYKDEKIRKRLTARADALVWLHYGFNHFYGNSLAAQKESLKLLEWIFEYQFSCLKRNDPEYVDMVLEEFRSIGMQEGPSGKPPSTPLALPLAG